MQIILTTKNWGNIVVILSIILAIGLSAIGLAGTVAIAEPQRGKGAKKYNQHHGYTLNFSLKKFERRIKRGVRSGELTRKETRQLRKRLRNLRQDVRDARADKRISKREKRRLEKRAKRLSRSIYVKKHNHATRYSNRNKKRNAQNWHRHG